MMTACERSPYAQEKTERSHINKHECQRAVRLALFCIEQGTHPSEITLLAAYQAQISLISKELKQQLPDFLAKRGFKRELRSVKVEMDPNLMWRDEVNVTAAALEQGRVSGEGIQTGRYRARTLEKSGQKVIAELEPCQLQPNEMPECSTIDRYQGAENQIVIISLVRSNPDTKLGFLGTEDGKNRMNVAQSRAKRGLYFIGNTECLRGAPHWKQLLDMLQERGSVGDQFPQICPRHPDVKNFAQEAEHVGTLEKKLWGQLVAADIGPRFSLNLCPNTLEWHPTP